MTAGGDSPARSSCCPWDCWAGTRCPCCQCPACANQRSVSQLRTNHSSPGPQLGGLLVQLGGAALHARLLVCRGGAGGQLRGPRSGGRRRQGAALGGVAAPGLQRGRGWARGPGGAQGGRSLGPGAVRHRPPATSRPVSSVSAETKDVLGLSLPRQWCHIQ